MLTEEQLSWCGDVVFGSSKTDEIYGAEARDVVPALFQEVRRLKKTIASYQGMARAMAAKNPELWQKIDAERALNEQAPNEEE